MIKTIKLAKILEFLTGLTPEMSYSVTQKSDGQTFTWESKAQGQPTEKEVINAEADLTVVNGETFSQWELTQTKNKKIQQVKQEAISRVQVFYDFVKTVDMYNYTEDLYLSTKASSRGVLRGRLLRFKNLRDDAVKAISTVNKLTTISDVTDYDVLINPGWSE